MEIGKWNTGNWNETAISKMFQNCTSFNSNIGQWNTSNVTNMSSMFGQVQNKREIRIGKINRIINKYIKNEFDKYGI